MKPYDVLIVGSGITGSTCACLLKQQGKKVLVLEKNPHLGGGVRTQVEEDIIVHESHRESHFLQLPLYCVIKMRFSANNVFFVKLIT